MTVLKAEMAIVLDRLSYTINGYNSTILVVSRNFFPQSFSMVDQYLFVLKSALNEPEHRCACGPLNSKH